MVRIGAGLLGGPPVATPGGTFFGRRRRCGDSIGGLFGIPGGRLRPLGIRAQHKDQVIKDDIRPLEPQEALVALAELEPKKFHYKDDVTDEHVGFIAEDLPELVAAKDKKRLDPMDIVAVLTKVTQQQQELLKEQQKRIERLEALLKTT